MRILYVHYGPQSGVTGSITSALRDLGAHIEFFNPVENFLFKTTLAGRQVPNVRGSVVRAVAEAWWAHGPNWKPYYLHTGFAFDWLSRRVAGEVARRRPDAVVQAGVLFGLAKPSRPTFLYLDHTRALSEAYERAPGLPPPIPFEPGWRSREAAVYRGASAIFVMSENVKRSLTGEYAIPPERVAVVGAGRNVAPDGPVPERRPFTFLFVGKNWEPKGGPELLEAFARVHRELPEARLWCVGAQHPAVAPPGVTFFGALPHDRLAQLFGTATMFVLPTLREAFGLSLLEAMSFGLPCIASNIEAIPEIVEDGRTGVLVPPRDARALGDAMLRLAADPALVRGMGAAGAVRYFEKFGWDRAARAMWERMEDEVRVAADERAGAAG